MIDILIHSVVAAGITALAFFFKEAGIVLAMTFFFWWELGQRIAKDKCRYNEEIKLGGVEPEPNRGLLYWINILHWGATGKKEAFIPMAVSLCLYISLLFV